MEIDGLGKRCALEFCRVLDYLPFLCNDCGLYYCNEHKTPISGHVCCGSVRKDTGDGTRCPHCRLNVGEGPEALSKHLKTDCAARRRTRADPLCAYCGKRDPMGVTCPSCRKMFCLEHRLLEDHDCVGITQKKPKAPKLALPKVPKVRLTSPRAAPVGDASIPEDERITCSVYFAVGNNLPARNMFFSRRYSAGKVVDEIAKRVSQLPSGTRYYLYAVKAGGKGCNLLPTITPLRDLPAGTIENGDAMVVASTNEGLPDEWISAVAPKKKGNSSSQASSASPRAGKSSSSFRKKFAASAASDSSNCTLV